jgi:ankyrin repeat protein
MTQGADRPSAGSAARLAQAIEANDLERVQSLMTREPALHRAPMGYGEDGPLTWVAECRVPREPPGPARLAIARWMIEHGSDVHQGGDGPLMRAALDGSRVPMMELLVSHGADVNALWHGFFPIVFAPCEAWDPTALGWLLDHGADPNPPERPGNTDAAYAGTALDDLLGSYARGPERLAACIDLLLAAGGTTRFDEPAVLDLLRGRLGDLAARIDASAGLVERRFGSLDFGMTGGRRLTLRGTTLLHVASELGPPAAAALLLDRGADVDARADVDAGGVGGQTALFHSVSQFGDAGLSAARLLLDRGADPNVRARVPGDYDRPGEVVECTPLGYALRFGGAADRPTVALLRERGAVV